MFIPTQGNRGVTDGHLYGMEEVAYAFYWTVGQGYFPWYGYSFYFFSYGEPGSISTYVDPKYCYHVSYGHPVRPVRAR